MIPLSFIGISTFLGYPKAILKEKQKWYNLNPLLGG